MTEDVIETRITNETVLTTAQIEKLRLEIGHNESVTTERKINFKIDGEKLGQAIDNLFFNGDYDSSTIKQPMG